MPATFVTAATLKASLGVGTLYDSYTWIEDTCQTAQDMISSFLWFNVAPTVATGLYNNVATVVIASPGMFVVGQSVTIGNSGATYNGTRTITGVGPSTLLTNNTLNNWHMNYPRGYSFLQFAITASNEDNHLILPYGTMTGPDHKTQSYATTPGINSAALILATNIWQARMSTQNGQAGIDGYSPSPYTMSASMMATIRGLLAPYLAPASMVG